MKNRYSVIVFDLGNTVIRFDHNISAKKISSLFMLDPKKVYDTFFDSEMTRSFEKGLISPKEFYRRVSSLLGIKLPYRDFVAIWNDIFWEDEGIRGLLKRLKRSYRLFLISNLNRLHFDYIKRRFDIIGYFDDVVLSFMVGSIKPEGAIFEDMIKRAGGDRTRLLYVDDREDLVNEARRLGIDSVRYEGLDSLVEVMKQKGVI